MHNIKEQLITSYLEENDNLDNQTAEQERANREWNKRMTAAFIPNMGVRGEIEDAAYELAGAYQYDGLRAGFEMACHLFGELLAEMLRGGAQA